MTCTCHRPELWLSTKFMANVHLSWCPVWDELAVANRRASTASRLIVCTHPRLRTFTFSDGKTIQSCPDCAEFDAKRWDVIGTNVEQYDYSMPTTIGGAPSLHASQILAADLSKFTRLDRPEEVYDNDSRIVVAFKRHSSTVRNKIYNRIRPHAQNSTRAQELTKELVNDVWVRVIEHINEFHGKSALTTWVISIALHAANDWIDAQKTKKRTGEVLSDFVAKNEDDEFEGDAYPDAKQDKLVGFGSGERRKFVYQDVLPFTASKQVVQVNAAMENGEPATPLERLILRDWILSNLREMQLRYLHGLLPRATTKLRSPESTKWWYPNNYELYLDAYQQLRKRRDKI